MSDLIRRIDAMQACQVAPSDEWSKATKGGYNQAATDCAMAVLRVAPVSAANDEMTIPESETDYCIGLRAQLAAMTAALDALIAAVEAGDKMGTVIAARDCLGLIDRRNLLRAADGSLDAAKALHEALLPGWDMQINTYEDDSFEASVSQPLQVKTYDGVSPFMARAWLLAILRALAAIKEPKT